MNKEEFIINHISKIKMAVDKLFNTPSFVEHLKKKLIISEVQLELDTWDIKVKSPYSNSFYNAEGITWDYKPDNSLRVSDHWNFYCRGKIHCKTDNPEFKNGWALGKYNGETKTYNIIKYFKLSENEINQLKKEKVETVINNTYQKTLDNIERKKKKLSLAK